MWINAKQSVGRALMPRLRTGVDSTTLAPDVMCMGGLGILLGAHPRRRRLLYVCVCVSVSAVVCAYPGIGGTPVKAQPPMIMYYVCDRILAIVKHMCGNLCHFARP